MSCPICLLEIKNKFKFKLCGHTVCLSCAFKLKKCKFQTCVICRGDTNLKNILKNGSIMLIDEGHRPKKEIEKPVIFFRIEMQKQRSEESLYDAFGTDSDDEL